MKNGGPFGIYTSDKNYELGFCTVPPKTNLIWESPQPGRFLIPTRDNCLAGEHPLSRLHPSENVPNPVQISNRGDRLALLFTLTLSAASSLIFFGSRAQGTHLSSSDVDLLIITPDCDYVGATHGALSVYTVPPEEALRRVRNGDLFFGSLLQTGQPLFDPQERFDALTKAFTPRPQPTAKRAAQAIGTLMLKDSLFDRFPEFVIGRALWCFRTILLAEGENLFLLPHSIHEKDRIAHDLLIAARNKKVTAQTAAFDAFTAFMTGRRLIEEDWLDKDFNTWKTRFEASGNAAGLKTLTMLEALAKRA